MSVLLIQLVSADHKWPKTVITGLTCYLFRIKILERILVIMIKAYKSTFYRFRNAGHLRVSVEK